MSGGSVWPVGRDATDAAAQQPTYPGRIVVRERALRTAVRAAAADVVGVGRDDVSVDVAEHAGGLAVRLATPLSVPDLDDLEAVAAATPVVERLGALQQELQARLGRLTGRDITRVDITITGATVPPRRRVR
ncbi:hypothetical protein N3K63_14160 [Microbacterium sp. W1N]|uniref:hypothetical protein n=1 Tax=Microbacterium festucae TaxID=2977531 RepID=UPI0021C13F95|nr:hypothetical protein [Microbacterium festucae]MCT9821425.1 hypothetical protein [Microbacterium festucae]